MLRMHTSSEANVLGVQIPEKRYDTADSNMHDRVKQWKSRNLTNTTNHRIYLYTYYVLLHTICIYMFMILYYYVLLFVYILNTVICL